MTDRPTRPAPLRRREHGYMYEYPLILMGTLITLSVILPRMTRAAAKIVLPLAAIPVLVALYYMLITPGWQPDAKRLGKPWNWIVFLCAFAAIVAGIALFWVGGEPR